MATRDMADAAGEDEDTIDQLERDARFNPDWEEEDETTEGVEEALQAFLGD